MRSFILLALFALAACSPEYPCQRYGFQKGTTAYAQCVQAEVLGSQQRSAILMPK